jgi:hypothetical protein
MEAQPIALGLFYLLAIFSEGSSLEFLDSASIALLLLGLQWWAMLVRHLVEHGLSEKAAQLLQFISPFVAFGIILVTYPELLNTIPLLIIAAGLVAWAWKRGIDWARKGLNDEQQILVFRIGFIVLVVVLFMSVLFSVSSSTYIPNGSQPAILAQALPLFFFSGLIALSFTRLGLIRKENAQRPTAAQTASTRRWLVLLTFAWIVIVAAAIALEVFSFQAIQTALIPLWNLLGLLANGILFLIYLLLQAMIYLLTLLGLNSSPRTPPKVTMPKSGQNHLAPPHLHAPPSSSSPLVGLIILFIAALVIIVFIIRIVRQRWHISHDDEGEEEIREGLSMRSIMQARRQERQKRRQQKRDLLEALDPTSARARYRELLQTMAAQGSDRGRRPNETPAEYQRRLLMLIEKAPSAATSSDAPPDPAILAELTDAYDQERYGGKQLDQQQHTYLRQWVPHLLKRLTGNTSRQGSVTWKE